MSDDPDLYIMWTDSVCGPLYFQLWNALRSIGITLR